jgi:peptidoglycan hydrolase-like protein with peptidoglycan-binding domain
VALVVAVGAAGTAVVQRGRLQELLHPADDTTGHTQIDNGSPVSTTTVARRDLSAQTQVDGTLGYTGAYSVVAPRPGATVTWLPDVGQVIRRGHALYELDGAPVVLLYGAVPAYRDLALGDSGPDVRQLNANLVALGYADSSDLDPDSDDFGWATRAAVKKLQDHLGVTEDGVLHLGQAVFLPQALRVTAVQATLGGQTTGPVLQGTSTSRQVKVELDAAQQSWVKKGDRVQITLPDRSTTTGRVSKVGRVATAPASQDAGSDANPTVEVDITLDHPSAAGSLDQAPVQVQITTDTVKNALVVPVTALLSLAGGGYAVEAVQPDGSRRLVGVEPGIFSDADGLVQVTDTELQPGWTIVAAGS